MSKNEIVKQSVVVFYNSNLRCALDGEGKVWVSVKEVCESIGVDRATQIEKLKSREDLSWRAMPLTALDGKTYTTACVEVEDLPAWLYTISPDRVLPEVKPTLIKLQRECAKAIKEHFFPKAEKEIVVQTEAEKILEAFTLLQSQVAIERAAKEEAIRTKALISDKKTATALATASHAVQAKNKAEAKAEELAIQLSQSQQWITVLVMEKKFGQKFDWRPLKKWHVEKNVPVKKVHDERYGEVSAYHKDAWEEVYGKA